MHTLLTQERASLLYPIHENSAFRALGTAGGLIIGALQGSSGARRDIAVRGQPAPAEAAVAGSPVLL